MLSGLVGLTRSLFGTVGDAKQEPEGEAAAGGQPVGDETKLPIDGKRGVRAEAPASPASTRAPAGSPGSTIDSSSPGTSLASGTPFVVRNTFLETPLGRPLSLDGFYEHRDVRSCPTSPIGAPPGLNFGLPSGATDEHGTPAKVKVLSAAALEKALVAEAEAKAKGSGGGVLPSESPSRTGASPMVWPRTMSGDTLEAMFAAAAEASARSKEQNSGGESLSCKVMPQPMVWPRTFSGDNLEAALASLMENSPPSRSPTAGAPSELPKPTMWPRTMSRDDLDFCLPLDEPSTSGKGFARAAAPAAQAQASKACPLVPPPPPQLPPVLKQAMLPPPPSAPAAAPDAKVVSIADALPAEPELGTPDMPTLGSRCHRLGSCKPCAFLHTKGCKNGSECPFCHLCERGEKKRRQREKWQQQRQQEQAVAAAMVAVAPMLGMPMPMMRPPMPLLPMGLSAAMHLPVG